MSSSLHYSYRNGISLLALYICLTGLVGVYLQIVIYIHLHVQGKRVGTMPCTVYSGSFPLLLQSCQGYRYGVIIPVVFLMIFCLFSSSRLLLLFISVRINDEIPIFLLFNVFTRHDSAFHISCSFIYTCAGEHRALNVQGALLLSYCWLLYIDRHH